MSGEPNVVTALAVTAMGWYGEAPRFSLIFSTSSIRRASSPRRPCTRAADAATPRANAWSTGWGWDFQEAEIEFRKAGGSLDGMMGVTHYAPMLYPATVLGDRELWPRLRENLLAWMDSGENESSLIPQWEASLRFDQREALRDVRVPMHVIAFDQDVQAPPQDGRELADIVPSATFHLLAGMGHGSWYGHAHETINPYIAELLRPD